MQNAIRSACREGKTNKNQNRGEEELPGAEVVAALVLLLLLEAVLVLVLLEAEAVDSRTAAVALLLAAEREFLPPPLSFVSFPFRSLPFLLLPWFSFLLSPSFYLFPLSPLFFSRFSFRLFTSSSVLLSFFFLPFSPAFLGSIYRGQGRCFLQLSRGAVGWSAIGRGCRGSVGGARWVVGHCVRSVGSRRERGADKNFKKKHHFSLLPRCMFGGEEER